MVFKNPKLIRRLALLINGSSLVAGFLGKIPQICRIEESKETEGFSFSAEILEYFGLLIIFAQNFSEGKPSTYFIEHSVKIFHILVLLGVAYFISTNKIFKSFLRVFFLTVIPSAFFYWMTLGNPNKKYLKILMKYSYPINPCSKLIQLYVIWRSNRVLCLSTTTLVITMYCNFASVLLDYLWNEWRNHWKAGNLFLEASLSIIIYYLVKYRQKRPSKRLKTN